MNKPCTRCKGTGINVHEAWTAHDGTFYPERRDPCLCCEGRGDFPEVDVAAVLAEIKGRKGLRSARPKSRRAYYVWRMARFHGGADVTMPVCASIDVAGDPFVGVLDIMSERVAQRVYGTDMAGTYRWSNALGHDLPVPDGMPASAYSGGPVADSDKPIEEEAELV